MGKKKMLMRKFGSVAIVNNTFIGGVASVINTPALLAAKLQYYPSGSAFSENDIQNLTIIGDDIECHIGVDYQIKQGAFNNIGYSNITYYNDIEGNCVYLYVQSFAANPTIKSVYFPNVVTLENGSDNGIGVFENASMLEICYLPKCINYEATTAYSRHFLGCINLKVIYAEPTMETINGGSIEGDLAYANSNYGTNLRFVTDAVNRPNNITDLAVNAVYATSIKLDWSVPSSTNAIDYYEVYVDGVFYKNVNTNEIKIFGLTNLQTYNFSVIAVDIFYNKSEMSNIVTQQINGVGNPVFSDPSSIISYYKFENNVLDSVGVNNGIATDITYASGLVGDAGVFNGSSSKVDIGTKNLVGGKSLFSVSSLFKLNSITGNEAIFGCWGTNNSFIIRINILGIEFYTATSNGVVKGEISGFSDTTSWHNLICTYDGSALKMYLDGIHENTVAQTGVINTSTGNNETIGDDGRSGSYFDGYIDDTSIFNKALSQTEVTEINNIHNAGSPLI